MIRSNKYGNRIVTVDGIDFDSKKEAKRYWELKQLLKAGKIKDLELQVPFELIPAQFEPDVIMKSGKAKRGKLIERACDYVADFVYYDVEAKTRVVEDVKGYRSTSSAGYAKFVIKRKMMLYKYGIRVREV